ncbi:beta-galactosidase [Elysia marginata]|uniref:Beta-galactosidase n=1 Tax=Elysia marginata TaxID=1093978 RepID=A0AAV4G709_9GAST|nr:beta-galactosidase [Elysia marginata]
MLITNKVYITDPIIANKPAGGGVLIHFSKISKESAHCIVKIHIANDKNTPEEVFANITLTDKNGRSITKYSETRKIPENSQNDLTVEMEIENPLLWDIQTPNLYELSISLHNKNKKVDELKQNVGIRKIELNPDGFFLNGKKVYLRGTNRHQEYPYVGYAMSKNAHYRDAVKIKQAGFDMVRTSHYPQDNAFLDACDELGIIVMNPIPGWQFYQDGEFSENSYQNIRDMVRRDRNHPCVVFWENSLNESQMTEDYILEANKILKEELPFNDTYTCGFIDHPSYDLYIPARQHANPPNYWTKYQKGRRKIFIAEYGDWEYYAPNMGFNQSTFSPLLLKEHTSRQLREYGEKRLLQQAMNFQEAANSNRRGKNTIGHANWLMFDYNRGYADDLEASGIDDIFRLPKFSHYFYKSQRPSTEVIKFRGITIGGPMVKIASYWNEQSSLPIKVYSNCHRVALYLNDSLVGLKSPKKDGVSENLISPPFEFSIPKFSPGMLVAKGYIGANIACSDTIITPKNGKKLKVFIDKSGIDISRSEIDVLIAHAYITDKDGNILSSDNNTYIRFVIETPSENNVEIVGKDYVKAKSGIASILIRVKPSWEYFKLKSYAPDMENGEVFVK